jgi:hypothetical protein
MALTSSILRGGLTINEIFTTPAARGGGGFDTNGDGTIEAGDEFVELYNLADRSRIDLTGLELWNRNGSWFTFPLAALVSGNHAIVVSGNTPRVTSSRNPSFAAGLGNSNVITDVGDNVVLYDPTANQFIQAVVGKARVEDPTTYPGFPASASRVGLIENFGISRGDGGESQQRDPDGEAGSFAVTTPTPAATNECFLTGTLISTARGRVPVEALAIGDQVYTWQGGVTPIRWIGRQRVTPETAHPLRSYPIQIKAGALGHNLPQRDLSVSPDHALLVEGLLINAGALVNGRSIRQVIPETAEFDYYHIELAHHALLVAEGVPAESFIPQNAAGRGQFDNGVEYERLYPQGEKVLALPMAYPRVSSVRQLPRFVASRLEQVAETLTGKVARTA